MIEKLHNHLVMVVNHFFFILENSKHYMTVEGGWDWAEFIICKVN